jgi:hypothetical protein
MSLATSGEYGGNVQRAESRRCLSSMENSGTRALDHLDVGAGKRCDSASPLQEVEQGPLGTQDVGEVSPYHAQGSARVHRICLARGPFDPAPAGPRNLGGVDQSGKDPPAAILDHCGGLDPWWDGERAGDVESAVLGESRRGDPLDLSPGGGG